VTCGLSRDGSALIGCPSGYVFLDSYLVPAAG